MSGALYVLNFYSAIFVDQLKRGRKTATIRLGDKSRKYKRGQVVWVTVGFRHQPREKIFSAVIDDVEVKPISELSRRDVEHDNPEFRRLEETVEALDGDGALARVRTDRGAYDADLRAVYTTTAPALQSGNGNNGWNVVLNELLALRTADASARYYYGVVKTSYNSGVAGMGFVGGTARTAVGWDFLPSGSSVMAHELGHTMGRPHAPCGPAGGTDPEFPYAGGTIGTWGLQLNGFILKSPSTPDLMGYCQPAWVSDYNWTAMVQYRQSGFEAPAQGAAADGLLIWGRITPGGVVLEPAFRVPASGGNAAAPGDNQLDLIGSNGTVLRSIRFGATPISESGEERQFAFVVPGGVELDAVTALRVRAEGRSETRAALAGGDPEVSVARVDANRLSLRWNAGRYPMVLVRDGTTGRILSFARGGDVMLWSTGQNVDLQFSSGVRIVNRRERILK